MSLKAFLSQNAGRPENKEVMVSNRFMEDGKPVPFIIRAISEETNGKIRNDSTISNTFKGKQTTKLDTNKYLGKLVASSVVSPDLKDAELQSSYGVIGEDNLIRTMLLPGEFAELLEAVQSLNGFDAEKFDEIKTETKNS